MSSDQKTVDFILEKLKPFEASARQMFGEWGLYAEGKFFGMICDNHFYIKPTKPALAKFPSLPLEPPYKGAKDYILVDDELEEPEKLAQIMRVSLDALPLPKPKK